jgi:hypothetical protein
MIQNKDLPERKVWRGLLTIYLSLLILLGVAFRFLWVNWSQGANLHPDEYGLTNTLTQLALPDDLAGYFNTRTSPLSPYQRYNPAGEVVGNGPDNGMRWGQWPMILIRAAAEATGNTGYDELRLLGRKLSALADALTLLLIYLIGKRLYGPLTGLLAAALSALAVLQIQQSHFMTVDNFGVLFTTLGMYACVRIAGQPVVTRSQAGQGAYRFDWRALPWYALFGVAFGMALASKINLLPLGGMLLVAAFLAAADLKLKSSRDLQHIVLISTTLMVLGAALTVLTFRLTQPMSFREVTGDTKFFSFDLNPDWVRSMRAASTESSGIGGGPPAEQWAHRPILIFPLVNMLLWGLGLPLGLAGWAGLIWAAVQTLRLNEKWKLHLLPLVWTGGYFFFMATRWVKSIRYFLPIYPFLCLFAAWALLAWWRRSQGAPRRFSGVLPGFLFAVVTLGSLVWTLAFVNAVYRTDHTRVQATRWIFENIPVPLHLSVSDDSGQETHLPLAAPDGLQVSAAAYIQPFELATPGRLAGVVIAHAAATQGSAVLRLAVAEDASGSAIIDQVEVSLQNAPGEMPGPSREVRFHGAELAAEKTYYLIVSSTDERSISLSRSVIANESWDEGLPFPFDGRDPFGQLYRGVNMEVRWYDDENKRQMFLDGIARADYIILDHLPHPAHLPDDHGILPGAVHRRAGFRAGSQLQRPAQAGRAANLGCGRHVGLGTNTAAAAVQP